MSASSWEKQLSSNGLVVVPTVYAGFALGAALYKQASALHQLFYDPAPPRGITCNSELNYKSNADGSNASERDPSTSGSNTLTAGGGAIVRHANFPPPFPNGWYFLCEAKDLAVPTPDTYDYDPSQSVRSFSIVGEEIVAFRTEKGDFGAVSAYCPHQGVHIGCGGEVKGEGIACPYHLWKFGRDGKLLNIPQIKKTVKTKTEQGTIEKTEVEYADGEQPDCSRERNHLRSYPVQNHFGLLFVYVHADGEQPAEDGGTAAAAPAIPRAATTDSDSTTASDTELDNSSGNEHSSGNDNPSLRDSLFWPIDDYRMGYCGSLRMPDFDMHVMEPSHNTVDWYHFSTVHKKMGMHWFTKFPHLDMDYEVISTRSKLYKSKEDDGVSEFVDPKLLVFDQKVTKVTAVAPVPNFLVFGAKLTSLGMRTLVPFVGQWIAGAMDSAGGLVQKAVRAIFGNRGVGAGITRLFCSPFLGEFNCVVPGGDQIVTFNQTRFCCPQNMATHSYLPLFGLRVTMLLTMVPVAPFRTQCQIHGFASDVGGYPYALDANAETYSCSGRPSSGDPRLDVDLAAHGLLGFGRASTWLPGRWLRRQMCLGLMHALRSTLLQDREIWETKIMHETRNRVKGDSSWSQYDKWMQQFYSKSSMVVNRSGSVVRPAEQEKEW